MSLPNISNSELDRITAYSLSSVFQTMLGFGVESTGSSEHSGQKAPVPNLGMEAINMVYVGSVGFVGEAHGVAYLYMKSGFVESAAKKITGLDEEDLDYEIVSDACGELSNMFAGAFKNSLADFGYSSNLTIPTVLSGDELYISTIGVVRHLRQSFKVNDEEVVADLVLAEATS